jgi:hypothetical protein
VAQITPHDSCGTWHCRASGPREMFVAGAVKVRHRRHETACILRTVHTTSEYRISEGLHINEDSYGRVNAVGDQSIMFRLAKGCSLW